MKDDAVDLAQVQDSSIKPPTFQVIVLVSDEGEELIELCVEILQHFGFLCLYISKLNHS